MRLVEGRLLEQHLRLRGNDRERRINLMGDARGEQPDRGELFRLRQLVFEVHALREVVEDQQSPQHLAVFADQRGHGNVHDQLRARRSLEPELVQRKGRRTFGGRRQLRHQLRRKDRFQALSHRLRALQSVKLFHRRVPGVHALLQVTGHDTGIDGLDDVLVEVLQRLVLKRFLLERPVELGVFEGDAHVPADGVEQVDVLARKEVSPTGLSQAQITEGSFLDLQRQVVVQVQPLDRGRGGRRKAERPLDAAKEEIAFLKLRPARVEKAEVDLIRWRLGSRESGVGGRGN